MKTLNIYAALLFSIFAINLSFAQKNTLLNTKENIKVWGNCETCKHKIENAAKAAGAATSNWNTETKILALTYDGSKTSSSKIQQAIALARYDTQDFAGDKNTYSNLPGCCKYERESPLVNNKTSAISNCKNLEFCKHKPCYKDGTCNENLCKDIPACKSICCIKS